MRHRPVFGLDIDGTLGKYHEHFLRFAAPWLGVLDWPGPMSERSDGLNLRWGHDEYDGTCSLAEYMGISKATYRRIKLSYRMGGLKRSMPAYPWAPPLTRTLRSWGTEVWLCTTRPYLSHDNIDSDTRHWLRRNGFAWQGIIWGEHKYRELARTVSSGRVVAVLDDLPEMCDQAAALGMSPVLALRDHNRHHAAKYDTAETEQDTLEALKARLALWKG